MIWLLLALLMVCSGSISASETALFSLSRQALYQFGRTGGPLRRRVFGLMQEPRRVLMTVLITNTAVNVAIFGISFVAMKEFRHQHPTTAVAASLAVLFMVIIFGEMVPKAIALNGARVFAPPAAALIAVLQVVLGPLRWLLATVAVDPLTRLFAPSSSVIDAVSTDELRLLVEHSAREGHIDSTENDMLQAVVALADVSVREVMAPRVDIRYVSIDDDRAAVLKTLKETSRRRLPVCGRDLDDIRGVLYARDVYLRSDLPLSKLIRRARFVPEQVNLMQLLRHFRCGQSQLAIVVDEYGGTAGLVTIEDVVKCIVGDLPDYESQRPAAPSETIDENTYRLSGDLSARTWADRFAVGEIDRHVDTVAGLILAKLGRLPRVGDTVRIRNLTLTVESMRERRIGWVLLKRHGNFIPPAGEQS